MAKEVPGARLLPPREAAVRLGSKVGTLANRRCAGLGPPFIRIGTKILYDERDIEAFIKENRVDPTAAE